MRVGIETTPEGVIFHLDNGALDVVRQMFAPLGEAALRGLFPAPTRQFRNQAVNAVARSSLQLFTEDELRAYRRAIGKEITRRKRHRRRLARIRRRRPRAARA